MKIIVCLFVTLVANAEAATPKISDFVTPCHVDDPEINQCVKLAMLQAIPTMFKGVRELGLIPYEPLEVTQMVMDLRENGLVGLKLTFINSKHSGLSNLTPHSLRVVPERMYFEINMTMASYIVSGDYDVSGRILLLPITGSGPSKYIMKDLKLSWVFYGKPETRNNEVYARITDCKFHISFSSGSLRFNNLFNGDSILGESMNWFLNYNFLAVMHEVLPALEDTYSALFLRLVEPIFASVPYSEIFPGVNLTAVRAGDFNL